MHLMQIGGTGDGSRAGLGLAQRWQKHRDQQRDDRDDDQKFHKGKAVLGDSWHCLHRINNYRVVRFRRAPRDNAMAPIASSESVAGSGTTENIRVGSV
jgi:hypothetical protein